jgi:hypothetical protein
MTISSDPRTLVVIPNAVATHVVGGDSIVEQQLAQGDLTLLAMPDNDTLVLQVGSSAAFPLTPGTPFGTLADTSNVYVFVLPGSHG